MYYILYKLHIIYIYVYLFTLLFIFAFASTYMYPFDIQTKEQGADVIKIARLRCEVP